MHTKEEEHGKETREQNTDKQDVISGFEEVKTGRSSAGLVREGEDRCQTNVTSGKGKGKGNGEKGEHGTTGAAQNTVIMKGRT